MWQAVIRISRASKEIKTVAVATLSPAATSCYVDGMIYTKRCVMLVVIGS